MAKIKKKAIFFSIIALFFVFLFTLNIDITKEPSQIDTSFSASRTKIELLNNQVNDLEDKYLSRMINIIGWTTLEAMSEQSTKHGTEYKNNFKDYFSSVFMNGSYSTVDLNPYLNGTTFYAMETSMEKLYESAGLRIQKLKPEVIDIYQKDPWTIHLTMRFDYFFEDLSGISNWKGQSIQDTDISIVGLWYKDKYNNIYRINKTVFVADTGNCSVPPPEDTTGCDLYENQQYLGRLIDQKIVSQEDIGLAICHNLTENCNRIVG